VSSLTGRKLSDLGDLSTFFEHHTFGFSSNTTARMRAEECESYYRGCRGSRSLHGGPPITTSSVGTSRYSRCAQHGAFAKVGCVLVAAAQGPPPRSPKEARADKAIRHPAATGEPVETWDALPCLLRYTM